MAAFSPPPQISVIGITSLPHPKKREQKIAARPTVFAGEAARTCYSRQGIYRPQDYLKKEHQKITDRVIAATRKAGHLTTRQHFFITFGISHVSRQFIWSFLHSHPFYNSEQVSQRYVPVKEGQFYIPPLKGPAYHLYLQTTQEQIKAYQHLKKLLSPLAAQEYFRLFPGQKNTSAGKSAVEKKAQEVARYVLGVNTFAYLYHTINILTLLRYYRAINFSFTPEETKAVVRQMIKKIEAFDPHFHKELDNAPLPGEEIQKVNPETAKKSCQYFDRALKGKTSRLIDYSSQAPHTLALAVRSVLGLTPRQLPLSKALALVLDPAQNHSLGEVLNLTTMVPISRCLQTINYTFLKKLSHTADSQDQRHRLVPGTRPLLNHQYSGEPDYITPALVKKSRPILRFYQETMKKTFTNINKLLKMGVPAYQALYLLPNAFPIRFVESGSLLHLHHKYRMRLCYNAQREIWQASKEEVEQISQVHPQIGRFLLPPCRLRFLSQKTPFCPEGNRFCGQPIWRKKVSQFPPRLI